jgi:hypothetical protein
MDVLQFLGLSLVWVILGHSVALVLRVTCC